MRSSIQPPSQIRSGAGGVASVGPTQSSSNLKQPTSVAKPLLAKQVTNSAKQQGNIPLNQVFTVGNTQQPSQNQIKPQTPALPQQLHLSIHKIQGFTSIQPSADIIILPSQHQASLCVYLAQSFIVFYDFRQNSQVLLYQNANPNKPYRALAFDSDRNWLYAAEGNCKQGEIQIFKVDHQDPNALSIEQKMVLRGHKYGIREVKVKGELVVSVGDDNDKGMLVWETRSPRLLSANSMTKAILLGIEFLESPADLISFCSFGSANHLKVWKVKVFKDDQITEYSVGDDLGKLLTGQKIPKLVGSKLVLPLDQGFCYTKVISQAESLFILGYKVQSEYKAYSVIKYNLSNGQIIAQIKQPSSSNEQTLTDLNPRQLLITGSFRRMQIIDKATFKFVNEGEDFKWAQPPQKGHFQMITQEIFDYLSVNQNPYEGEFSKITGVVCEHGVLVQVLQDNMIIIHELATKKLLRVLMMHPDSIYDLAFKDYQGTQMLSYLTCSKDNTIRFWNTKLTGLGGPNAPVDNDLIRILYLDYQMDHLGNMSVIGRPTSSLPDEEQGIKCMALETRVLNHLAVGDMIGNIRIYQLKKTGDIQQINFIEAHEGKVNALQYSEPFSNYQFLVSGSSDRMIHIFLCSATEEYELIQTIDAHSTSIQDLTLVIANFGVKNKNKITQFEKQLRLYSCSTDKALQVHRFSPSDKKFISAQAKEMNKSKVYKMVCTDSTLIMAKDQGQIEIKALDGGKQTHYFQQTAQNSMQSKSLLDYTGLALSNDLQLIALHDKEKSIQIREAKNCSNLLARFSLSEPLSSLQFTPDNQYLICSSLNSKDSGGGLIYIFKIEHSTANIKAQQSLLQSMRNIEKTIIVEDQPIPPPIQSRPSMGLIQQENSLEAPVRKLQIKEDLYNTWAKSSQHTMGSQVVQKDSTEESKGTPAQASYHQDSLKPKQLAPEDKNLSMQEEEDEEEVEDADEEEEGSVKVEELPDHEILTNGGGLTMQTRQSVTLKLTQQKQQIDGKQSISTAGLMDLIAEIKNQNLEEMNQQEKQQMALNINAAIISLSQLQSRVLEGLVKQ